MSAPFSEEQLVFEISIPDTGCVYLSPFPHLCTFILDILTYQTV